jgi:CHAT domain-containing protein/tetratricopeptide (TPR) repeat protein
VEKPSSLLRAESLIGSSLAKNPTDVEWLQAKGRADLLDGNYSAAITSLQHALELRPDASSLLTDLASAYSERAEREGQAADYGTAVELLGKALARAPDDDVALYNRAIVSARIYLYSQAISDWEHFLRLDPTGEWAADVRGRMEEVQRKLQHHEGTSSQPLLNPAELAASGMSEDVSDAVDQRLEDYVHLAMLEWLPNAFGTVRDLAEQREARRAAEFLAKTALERHGDRWLSDLLATSSSQNFGQALVDLAASARASEKGDYAAAEDAATRAESLFADGKNRAGKLQSQIENIYALHLSHSGEKCLQTASTLAPELNGTQYLWLQVQFRLERAACLGTMGNYGEAEATIEDGLKLASSAGYASIYLRGLGFASDLASTIGDFRKGWGLASKGLEIYWSGPYRSMLGYNLYTDLDTAAEARDQPHLQVAVWEAALGVIASNQDQLLQAMAHSWMGKAATSAGIQDLAEREFAAASQLFEAAPRSAAARNNQIEVEILLAQSESRRGSFEEASTRLNRISSSIPQLSDHYLAIRYYSALGELKSRVGSTREGERLLESAVSLAEEGLKSLQSGRERSIWNEEVSGAYRNLVRSKLDRGDVEEALEIWEWYRGAPLRAGTHPLLQGAARPADDRSGILGSMEIAEGDSLRTITAVAPSLSTLQTETIVSYAEFEDGLWIWSYDNRGILAIKSPAAPAEIDSLASRFVEFCSTPSSDTEALRRDARKLYELLIEPIRARLLDRSIVVFELDAGLVQIPMEVVLGSSGDSALDTVSIVTSPGLYFSHVAHREYPLSLQVDSLFVAVSAPLTTPSSGLPPLLDVEQETTNISRGFAGARLLLGKEATLSSVMDLMPGAQIFHFAGHAVSMRDAVDLVLVDSDIVNQASLLTADLVSGQKIGRMQLAVLAACATSVPGRETYKTADDLAMGFLRAGVPHVIGSRWNVDSRSTEFLMERFYARLFSGKDVAEAMHEAEVEVRSRPEWNHPYFWASFETSGMH